MKEIICFFESSNFGLENFNGFATLKQFNVALFLYHLTVRKQRQLDPFKIVLVTDEVGSDLIKKTKLDFDEIRVIKTNKNSRYEILCQDNGFIRIDLDTIPFAMFPLHLYNSQILVQEIYDGETPTNIGDEFLANFKEFNRFIRHTDDVYESIKEDVFQKGKINSISFGIMGGNDVTLLRKYTEAVFEFQKKNRLQDNKFFESIYSYYFFKYNGGTITPVVKAKIPGKDVLTLYDRTYVIQLTEYSKKNKIIIEGLEDLLKNWYPQTYNKLLTL